MATFPHPTEEAQALIVTYIQEQATWTERRRAGMEAQIWAASKNRPRGQACQRREYLATLLDATKGQIEDRANLYNAGILANPLWEALDAGTIGLGRAVELLHRARMESYENSIPVEKVLQDLLNGKGKGKGRRPKAAIGPTAVRASASAAAEAKAFWAWLRQGLKTQLSTRLQDVDSVTASQFYREFERDLAALLGEYQSKLHRVRSEAQKTQQVLINIAHRDVINACSILHMDPPARGRPADLVQARTQKRRLVRLFHPDTQGEGAGAVEQISEQFDDVIKAFEILEVYNQKLIGLVGTIEEIR